jgi:hypothetical protein
MDKKKIEGVKISSVIRVAHIPSQGARMPFGLDPLPHLDSVSGLWVVRLFCMSYNMT